MSDSDETAKLAPWSEPAFNSLSSPYYNESHIQFRDELKTYLEEHILPYSLDWEAQGGAPRDVALKWARSGFAHQDVPDKYRPKDIPLRPSGLPREKLDVFHFLLATDQGARIDGGVGTSLAGASVIGAPPIIAHGTEEQKQKWLPGLFDWSTSFTLGITEPSGGSDVANIKTTAVKTADGKFYVVNGLKKWITGTPWASHMTTAVRTGGPGMGGISMIVIPLDSPGFSHKRIPNSGQAAGGASLVTLENVKVPVENLLGHENGGFKIIMTNFNRERFVLAIGCNRMARECLNSALRYAHDRETFGKPLIANQIIRSKIAKMARGVESHWAWLEQIAYHVSQAPDGFHSTEVASRIALAKVAGGRLVEKNAREAQQILGGAGYQRGGVGARVEQISRDLRMMVVGGGSEEIMDDLAVRMEIFNSVKKGWKI
jgi:alkylation response protein AidB-like acyl-CoA dehydrogenase